MKKIRRYLLILLAVALIFSAIPVPDTYAGQQKSAQGSGTEASPYILRSPEDLLALTDLNACYRLEADIDLGGMVWSPIGSLEPFSGVFDGAGFSISNFKLERQDHTGFFSKLGPGSIVKHLNLKNVTLSEDGSHPAYAGVLAGFVHDTTIRGCTVSESDISASAFVGGLIGYAYLSSIEQCLADVNVVSADSAIGNAGGLIGSAKYSSIKMSRASGTVNGGTAAGGFIGSFDASSSEHVIENCYSAGDVSSSNNSNATGTFAGSGWDLRDSGWDQILNSYSSGAILQAEPQSGFYGSDSYIEVRSSYMKADSENTDPLARTEAQMMQQSTFSGWDFDTVWQIKEGEGFPYLIWEDDGGSEAPTLTLSDIEMKVGDRVRIQPVFTPPASDDITITYAVDQSGVIEIDEDGIITALREGAVTVTGTAENGAEDTFIVTVTDGGGSEAPTLTLSDIEMKVGDRVQIHPVFTPPASDDITITYAVDQSGVIEIDEDGIITALREGVVTVTGTASNGAEDTFIVTVTDEPEEGDWTLVATADELLRALQDKTVSHIRFTNDIHAQKTMLIAAARDQRELVIDGGGFTFTENWTVNYSTSAGIRLTQKGTIDQITVQNMKIIGQNGYGNIYIPAAVKDVALVYKDIEYKGPQIVYNLSGSVTFIDSVIHIDFADGGRYMGEVAEVGSVILGGDVRITKENDTDGTADKLFWLTKAKGKLEILPEANVIVDNKTNGRSNSSGLIYSALAYTIEAGAGSSFKYNGHEQFIEGLKPSSFVLDESAVFEVTIDGSGSNGFRGDPVLEVAGPVTVNNSAALHITTIGNLSRAMLRVNGNLTVHEDAALELIALENSTAAPAAPLLVMAAGGTADFRNPRSVLIYNSNDGTHGYARAVGYAAAGTLKITASDIRYWNNADASGGAETLVNPSSRWNSDDGTFFVEAQARSGVIGGFSSFTTSGYDGDDLNANTFDPVKAKIIHIQGQ